MGASLASALNNSEIEIPTSSAVFEKISASNTEIMNVVNTKADQTSLDNETARAIEAENALSDKIAEFTEVTEEEINALFQ
jgi:hypothetical protein